MLCCLALLYRSLGGFVKQLSPGYSGHRHAPLNREIGTDGVGNTSGLGMSATGDRQTGAALVADLSLSFQDELTATIHNAFGVALEIAVLEVTKLVGQALRDVRDQMHETLRENESLKQRLQSAEVELGAVRKANAVGRAPPPPPPGPQDEPQPGKQPAAPISAPVDPADMLLEEKFDFLSVEADSDRDRSFCEIREDGQVCSHDLTPDAGGQTASRCQPGGAAGM